MNALDISLNKKKADNYDTNHDKKEIMIKKYVNIEEKEKDSSDNNIRKFERC